MYLVMISQWFIDICLLHQSDWSYYQGQEPIKLWLIKLYRSYEYFRLQISVMAIFFIYKLGLIGPGWSRARVYSLYVALADTLVSK